MGEKIYKRRKGGGLLIPRCIICGIFARLDEERCLDRYPSACILYLIGISAAWTSKPAPLYLQLFLVFYIPYSDRN